MATFRDAALVLRTHKLAEADRIITLLTRDHGKVRAVAKSVRRTTSRFGARLEPFMHVDLQLYEGRSLDTITQAVTVAAYGGRIASDYPAFTAANAVVETADKLSPIEHLPARALFRLTLGAVAALARCSAQDAAGAAADVPGPTPPSPGAVVDSYLLRALALSGYAPSLSGCAQCGAAGPHRAFSAQAGGMVCQDCRPPGAQAPAPATVVLLGALLEGDWAAVAPAPPAAAAEAAALVRTFSEFHMERAVRSLRLVDRGQATQALPG
ncbi:MAG: DNA repair protein RecO [Bifidobacteriaceae bacterium]|jgi:DNA repair protein RecO (recombination protein O)|nr:DNA repair protein RecO [Bifidobacteriaceae bacterium]